MIVEEVTSIWRGNETNVWIAQGDSVFEYDGVKQHNRLVTGSSKLQIIGTSQNDLWVLCEGEWPGIIRALHYDGQVWQETEFDDDSANLVAWSGNDGRPFVVQRDGLGTFVSVHDGNFVRHAIELRANPDLVWGSASGDVWFTRGGRVWRVDALPWIETETPTELRDLHVDADGTAIAAGRRGEHYYEQSWQWTFGRPLNAVYRDGDYVWSSNDSGFGFYRRFSTERGRFEVGRVDLIWGTGTHDIWAIGNTASEVIAYYNGKELTSRQTSAVPSLRYLAGVGSEVWGIAPSGHSLVTYRDGEWATVMTFSTVVNTFFGTGTDDVWAFLDDGTAQHFDGDAWHPMDVGLPGPFRVAWGTTPRDVWVATLRGALAHYDGTLWSPVLLPGGRPADIIDGTAENNVIVVSNDGQEGQHSATFHLTHRLHSAYGGACPRPTTAYCNSSLPGHSRGAPATMDYCGLPTNAGGQVTYRIEVPIDGALTASVVSPSGEVSLVALGAAPDGGCDVASCRGHTSRRSSSSQLQLDVESGETLYLAVGAPHTQTPYRLDILCVKR